MYDTMTNPEELNIHMEPIMSGPHEGRIAISSEDFDRLFKLSSKYLSILKPLSEMVGAMKDAEAELAWLKQTAEDTRDNCRIVGYEDCIRGFRNNTTAIAKILGE